MLIFIAIFLFTFDVPINLVLQVPQSKKKTADKELSIILLSYFLFIANTLKNRTTKDANCFNLERTMEFRLNRYTVHTKTFHMCSRFYFAKYSKNIHIQMIINVNNGSYSMKGKNILVYVRSVCHRPIGDHCHRMVLREGVMMDA